MKKEKVFVFPAEHMEKFSDLPGLSGNISQLKYGCAFHGYFTDREDAEVNEDEKQLIPYVIIRRGDEILAYKRSSKSKEGRLHNKWSIGVGGHINPSDAAIPVKSINLLLSMAMQRELTEELNWGDYEICTINNLEEFGVLYDDSNAVGRVHVGYVLIVNMPKDSAWPTPKENTMSACKAVSLEEASQLPNLEGWSKIVLEAMLRDSNKIHSE